jgi:hypothetical protein
MNITIQDLKLLIAEKELELFALRRASDEQAAELAELKKPKDAPVLEAVK